MLDHNQPRKAERAQSVYQILTAISVQNRTSVESFEAQCFPVRRIVKNVSIPKHSNT